VKNGNFDHSRDKVAAPPPIRPVSVSPQITATKRIEAKKPTPRMDGAHATERGTFPMFTDKPGHISREDLAYRRAGYDE
jgi:hypothetical protein